MQAAAVFSSRLPHHVQKIDTTDRDHRSRPASFFQRDRVPCAWTQIASRLYGPFLTTRCRTLLLRLRMQCRPSFSSEQRAAIVAAANCAVAATKVATDA